MVVVKRAMLKLSFHSLGLQSRHKSGSDFAKEAFLFHANPPSVQGHMLERQT